jgi:hypothetical protein
MNSHEYCDKYINSGTRKCAQNTKAGRYRPRRRERSDASAPDGPISARGSRTAARPSCRPTVRLIILGVLAMIIVGNVLGGIAGHVGFGWLIPVVVPGSLFLRLARR